ncbi:MAG: glycosyltransferase [Pseudomonadota bacterium]
MSFYKRFLPKLNQPPATCVLPALAQGDSVPKIIHQTYFSESVPEEIQANIARLKTVNPGWDYRFYTDSDILRFIEENYDARVLAYFNRINPAYGAAKADLFRYLVVYRCGGAYLDIKSSTTVALDDVLAADDRYLLSYWKNKPGEKFEGFGMHPELDTATGEFQQWHVIAAPGHPFLKAVIETVFANIDRYLPSLHGVGQHGVVRVTGPVAYTLAILPLLALHPHRIVASETDLGLQYSIYKKFSHMHISKATHYTVLKEPIVFLSAIRRRMSGLVARLQKINDGMSERLRPASKS